MRRAAAISPIAAVLVAAAVLATTWPAPCAARDRPGELLAGELPAWLREARARAADPHAPWTLLHDELIVEPLPEGGTRVTTRFAARTPSRNVLASLGTFHAVYGPDDSVISANGWTIQPDGVVYVPHPKDDVSDIPWIKDGSVGYVRARHVELPRVIPGSIVAWEHQVRLGLDRGAMRFLFGHGDAPTRVSRATLRVPAGWRLDVRASGATFTESRSASEVTLELVDVAPPRPDPFPPADIEARPSAWLRWFSPDGARGFADWDAVGRWYAALAKDPASQAGAAAGLSRELAPASPADLRAAIERAFRFASRDVRYVAIEVGIGGYKPASPEATCRDRFGDCKAKSFLMRSLVEPWGLKAWPVLVRTRGAGPLDASVPTPGQFNHCIVAIELPDALSVAESAGWAVLDVPDIGRLAFLDATVSGTTSVPLRQDDQGTLALLVHDKGSRLVRLPEQSPDLGGVRVELEATLDATGVLSEGRLSRTWTGSQAARIRLGLLGADEPTRVTWAAARAQGVARGTTLSEHAITGLDDVSVPIVETCVLRGGRLAQRAMELLIVLPGSAAPSVLSDHPSPPPRAWPLDLGAPRTLEAIVRVHAPPDWTPEKLPAAWDLSTPHLTARVAWEAAADGTLTWRRTVQVLSSVVAPADYADFHRAVSSLAGRDAEGLTLIARGP